MKLDSAIPWIFVIILLVAAFFIVRYYPHQEELEKQEEVKENVSDAKEVVIAPEKAPLVKEEPNTIGNRLTGGTDGAADQIEADPSLIGNDLVVIYKNKTYSKDFIMIWAGESLTWMNKDDAPHMIVVDKDKTRYFIGDRFEAGQTYTKEFDDPGDYLVHDMFAGSAKLTLVVSEKS